MFFLKVRLTANLTPTRWFVGIYIAPICQTNVRRLRVSARKVIDSGLWRSQAMGANIEHYGHQVFGSCIQVTHVGVFETFIVG